MSAAVLTPPPQSTATPAGAVTPPQVGVAQPPPGIAQTAGVGPPAITPAAELWRFSRANYKTMLDVGILRSGDPVELLDGLLVKQMSINRPHQITVRRVQRTLTAMLPAGWTPLLQGPVALDESEPEPDVCVTRGDADDYPDDHPAAVDTPLLVEVSDSSLSRDRNWKRSIYARNGVAAYWIVNLVNRTLEVYSTPVAGEYTQSAVLTAADRADVVLDGVVVGSVAVAELLP